MFLVRSLIGRIAILAVLIIIVGGAGWWFFIREANSEQKEARGVDAKVLAAASAQAVATVTAPAASPAASASTAGVQPSASAAATAAGSSNIGARNYRIVEGQSEAWYLAPEKLAALPTSSVAKGTTKGITGEFHFTADALDPSRPTKFTVDLKALASDRAQRDRRVQDALETAKFPTASFTATKLTGLPREFSATDAPMQLTGMLEIHGVQKEMTWDVKVKQDQGILSGLATIKFKYSDFGINKPDIAGFVSVEDEVTIQIQLFAAPG